MAKFKIGSLFDGSGGFPLAASLCGIDPTWAAEVEPYPIAVTRSRFPGMKHLGSVTDIKGGEIEPVDVITFGSPCQDLSVAGKRAGFKHEAHGDDETTRSGLFMEAVRIIKEMREATNGKYPTFALWENVPGALSSPGKDRAGEDFRCVLEELIKIVEPGAVMPPVPPKGWAYADSYRGDGWSLAYRVFDAQYWGVPQRRRRIHLILDLRGERAREVLFEREGVRGYFAESETQGQETARNAADCSGADDREGNCLTPWDVQSRRIFTADGPWPALYGGEGGGHGYVCIPYGISSYESNAMKSSNPHSGVYEAATSRTLDLNGGNPACHQGGIAVVCMATQQGGAEIRTDDRAPTVTAAAGMSGNNQPVVAYTMQAFGDYKDCGVASGLKARDYKDATDLVVEVAGMDCRNGRLNGDLCGTLQAKPNGGFSYNCIHPLIIKTPVRYIVRRLTPTECARLQGFLDKWGHPDRKEDFTDEEYRFWLDVRNTHAAINGKVVKEHTKDQMLKWYNGLHTDSAEYKMWGNGIALPPALYCMQGMAEALEVSE